jgi:hypothetical protein
VCSPGCSDPLPTWPFTGQGQVVTIWPRARQVALGVEKILHHIWSTKCRCCVVVLRAVLDAPYLVCPAMRRVAYHVAPSCRVVASPIRAHERSAVRRCTIAWYCSLWPTYATGHDNDVCLHILQAPWNHVGVP